ncbi:Amino acid (Glutamine) ABC transporter, periplasmic amino acid binding protein [Legionella pneumophila subsp. pneumophila LPE509]|nr:Amino acid (Glutamine) ABC transporter, periplasmic amino acid binding protein [Legionella pneumophila subsp. pneumophila LPE509]
MNMYPIFIRFVNIQDQDLYCQEKMDIISILVIYIQFN